MVNIKPCRMLNLSSDARRVLTTKDVADRTDGFVFCISLKKSERI